MVLLWLFLIFMASTLILINEINIGMMKVQMTDNLLFNIVVQIFLMCMFVKNSHYSVNFWTHLVTICKPNVLVFEFRWYFFLYWFNSLTYQLYFFTSFKWNVIEIGLLIFIRCFTMGFIIFFKNEWVLLIVIILKIVELSELILS